jgi:hypothetical protein
MTQLDDLDLSGIPDEQTFHALWSIVYYSDNEERDFYRNELLLNHVSQENGARERWDSGFSRVKWYMRRRSGQSPYKKPGFYLVCVDLTAYWGGGDTGKSVDDILSLGRQAGQTFVGSELMGIIALQKNIAQLFDELNKLSFYGVDLVALELGGIFEHCPLFAWIVKNRHFHIDMRESSDQNARYARPVLLEAPKFLGDQES